MRKAEAAAPLGIASTRSQRHENDFILKLSQRNIVMLLPRILELLVPQFP